MADDQNELLLEDGGNKTCFGKPSLTCFLISLVLCTLAISFAVGMTILLIESVDHAPTVLIACGEVEGTFDAVHGVHIYKGIPYAASPTGELRWQRPVPLKKESGTCWKGIFRAIGSPPPCPCVKEDKVIGEEDCLFLDIYAPLGPLTPAHPDDLRPVVVWMNAGPLGRAATASPGVEVTTRTKAVFVNVQYRRGVLGFLVADQLGKNQTGNYGLWDQIEALRWIQDNIKNFGGDPKQVTLMSQSSGSTSAGPLLTSPYAKGLFQRAWLLNSAPLLKVTLEQAKVRAAKIVENMQCTNSKCLREKPLKDILIAAEKAWPEFFILDLPKKDQYQPPMAVVDGDLLPVSPAEAWKAKTGNYPDVPVLIGSMAQISAGDIGKLEGVKTDEKFVSYIQDFLSTFNKNLTQDAIAAYNFSKDVTQGFKYSTMVSDVRLGCSLKILSQNVAGALDNSVYKYVVVHEPSTRATTEGHDYSAQGWDTYAFFGQEDKYLGKPASNKDLNFIRMIRTVGESFIRTGSPHWRDWSKYPGNTTLIGDKIKVIPEDYHKVQCEFWASNGLLAYSQVN